MTVSKLLLCILIISRLKTTNTGLQLFTWTHLDKPCQPLSGMSVEKILYRLTDPIDIAIGLATFASNELDDLIEEDPDKSTWEIMFDYVMRIIKKTKKLILPLLSATLEGIFSVVKVWKNAPFVSVGDLVGLGEPLNKIMCILESVPGVEKPDMYSSQKLVDLARQRPDDYMIRDKVFLEKLLVMLKKLKEKVEERRHDAIFGEDY